MQKTLCHFGSSWNVIVNFLVTHWPPHPHHWNSSHSSCIPLLTVSSPLLSLSSSPSTTSMWLYTWSLLHCSSRHWHWITAHSQSHKLVSSRTINSIRLFGSSFARCLFYSQWLDLRFLLLLFFNDQKQPPFAVGMISLLVMNQSAMKGNAESIYMLLLFVCLFYLSLSLDIMIIQSYEMSSGTHRHLKREPQTKNHHRPCW